MMRFILRRLGHAFLLLVGVSVLAFLFTTLAPGNYFDEMRLNPQIAPETVAALRAQYQLDRPLPVRYASWLNSLLHGQMGFSFAYNSPVAPLLFLRARNTLLLTITATLIAWGIALPLGVWSAERFGRLPDRLLSWATAALLVEVVMSWPGLGPLLLESILSRDLYVVIGGVLFSTLFLVSGNFLADVFLYWADPRIRTENGAR